MPTTTTTRIDVHPNSDGSFAFAVITADHPNKPAWVTPNRAAWYTLACAAWAAGRQLKITYTTFTDGPGAQDFYAVTQVDRL